MRMAAPSIRDGEAKRAAASAGGAVAAQAGMGTALAAVDTVRSVVSGSAPNRSRPPSSN